MKTLLAMLVLSTSVFAKDPSVFTGKYDLAPSEDCDMASSESARAYIYTKRQSYHNNLMSLNFDVYGEDAGGDVIVIENGSHQTLGTSVDSHGKVTDTIKAKWASKSKLVVETRTQRPSIKLDYTAVDEISVKGNTLTVKSFIKGKPDQGSSVCKFKKVQE